MKNLIAYIAELKQIGKENLATELLAELIRSPLSEHAFRSFVSRFDITLPDMYRVKTQQGGIESRCIPDLWIRDAQGHPFVIIDSKFYAGFTHNQPNGYINEVKGGLVLFVVPDKRSSAAFTELCSRCDLEIKIDQVRPRQAKIGGTKLAVSTWTEILDALEANSRSLCEPSGLSRYNVYLNELRGFCEVAAKEVFLPLTGEQIAGSDIASLLHQFKWLTENLIRRCIEDNIVQAVSNKRRIEKDELGANFDSSLYFGRNLIIDNLKIWLGFFGSVWEERQKSPLWIEIDSKSDESRTFVQNLRQRKGNEFVMHGEDGPYLIAIPLTPGLTQSEQVESAVRFVADLKNPS